MRNDCRSVEFSARLMNTVENEYPVQSENFCGYCINYLLSLLLSRLIFALSYSDILRHLKIAIK